MGLFGVSAKSIVRSIRNENISTLDKQTRHLSKEKAAKVAQVVEATLNSLQDDFSSEKVRSTTLGFLTDLSAQCGETIDRVFIEQIFSKQTVKETFSAAMKSARRKRALKLLNSFPDLIFEKVDGKRIFNALSDEEKSKLISSGAINPKFLMEVLRDIRNG